MQVTSTQTIFDSALATDFLRATIFIIMFFYSIFALLIVRQVMIMSETLITHVSALVRGVAIIHAGFAIGLTIFIMGTL